MTDCYDCEHAIFDYEEYYGGYCEKIVVGCKIDREPETCERMNDYIKKYADKCGISVKEAETHEMVKEYKKYANTFRDAERGNDPEQDGDKFIGNSRAGEG